MALTPAAKLAKQGYTFVIYQLPKLLITLGFIKDKKTKRQKAEENEQHYE